MTEPTKKLFLPQCQSRRAKNHSFRRGNSVARLLNCSSVRTVSRFCTSFFSKIAEHHVNCDAKQTSQSIVKHGMERNIQAENLPNVAKHIVLKQNSDNVRAAELQKMIVLPRCQSLRLQKHAFRRGNLAPLFLNCSNVLSSERFFCFFFKIMEHHVNYDTKRTSKSIVKNGTERKIQAENLPNVEKATV